MNLPKIIKSEVNMKEIWEKTIAPTSDLSKAMVIEKGVSEKAMDSITLKKDSKGNIVWEIKAYGMDMVEALDKAFMAKTTITEQLEKSTEPEGFAEEPEAGA